MRLHRIREAILRRTAAQSTVQTTVLLLSVVAALVVGLLAMHTFASPVGHHAHGESAVMIGEDAAVPGHLAAGSELLAAATDCSGTCDPDHTMVGIVCVLALLVTGLSIIAAAANTAAVGPRARQSLLRMIAFVAAPANRSPDLNALSISRT